MVNRVGSAETRLQIGISLIGLVRKGQFPNTTQRNASFQNEWHIGAGEKMGLGRITNNTSLSIIIHTKRRLESVLSINDGLIVLFVSGQWLTVDSLWFRRTSCLCGFCRPFILGRLSIAGGDVFSGWAKLVMAYFAFS
jgi:hypothetical protein